MGNIGYVSKRWLHLVRGIAGYLECLKNKKHDQNHLVYALLGISDRRSPLKVSHLPVLSHYVVQD